VAKYPQQAIDVMRKTRAQMRPPSFQIRDAKTGERVDLRTVLTRALRAHEKVALREKFLAGGCVAASAGNSGAISYPEERRRPHASTPMVRPQPEMTGCHQPSERLAGCVIRFA
jgi:hypothetical protein